MYASGDKGINYHITMVQLTNDDQTVYPYAYPLTPSYYILLLSAFCLHVSSRITSVLCQTLNVRTNPFLQSYQYFIYTLTR